MRDGFADALVLSLERDELLRALGSAIAGLLREADEVRELAAKAEPELRTLTAASLEPLKQTRQQPIARNARGSWWRS